MRSFALFTLAIPALVALAAPSAEDPKLRARQCYVDRSGGAGGVVAGKVIDNSNGGQILDGDLVDINSPLIEGPLIEIDLRRRDDCDDSSSSSSSSATYIDRSGAAGGVVAGDLLDNSNGGDILDGSLLDVDAPLISGPLIDIGKRSGPSRLPRD